MMKVFTMASLALLSGCTAVSTDLDDVLPESSELAGEEFVHSQTPQVGDLISARWWERFGDPVLNSLVESTLTGNLDLAQAAANVREADARMRSASGGRGVSVDAGLSAGRSVSNSPAGGRNYTTPITPQLTIRWQADLFGRLRSIERARYAELLASEADRLAITNSLIAQAARFRVRISLLEREAALADEVVLSRTRTLEIVEGRYERGVSSTSIVDVHLARENLAAARAVLPAIQRDQELTYLALDVLLGIKPGSGMSIESLGSPLPNAEAPPTGIPAGLLDRRPDLLSARMFVESAVADADASVAALYPDLTLNGALGWTNDGVRDLFSAQTLFANLIGNLTAPLFSSGRLEADVDVAQARVDRVVAAYSASVLQAVREVEDAIVTERGLLAELNERIQQRDEALLAENLARDRYQRGLENLLTVLDTERRRTGAEERVLQLQAAVWNARIDLHLALGGDWYPKDSENSL
ncbi:MAG: NodT family efflux transporter outer membrane factor (OMF) lipoprotein [Hyphomicrobiaceae bacterium]|jgi:NodT family efflux transporter outer membrane factor (OMF) lipoprotein